MTPPWPWRRAQAGFGIIELIVALAVFSIGVLGLVAAAALAQRALNDAAAVERGARFAGLVLDSLLAEPAPHDGVRAGDGAIVRWEVTTDSVLLQLRASVQVTAASRIEPFSIQAARLRGAP